MEEYQVKGKKRINNNNNNVKYSIYFCSINIEYSVDFGKNWNSLLQPCFLDSACSHDVQHVYSSKIVLPSS